MSALMMKNFIEVLYSEAVAALLSSRPLPKAWREEKVMARHRQLGVWPGVMILKSSPRFIVR
jgi:hypothetical protein